MNESNKKHIILAEDKANPQRLVPIFGSEVIVLA
tara:strand:+ start:654 stop:755 length:102 start_codon:yes stop_codon:yes gene_type:complete